MSINSKEIIQLLEKVAETDELGGKKFESRYTLKPYKSDVLIGLGHVETNPELRERDRHLLYARSQEMVRFDTQRIGDREDFFGGVVTITPAGLAYLEANTVSWFRKQLQALASNVLTIVIAVIIALLSAWLLRLTGIEK